MTGTASMANTEVDFATWVSVSNTLQAYADGVDRADMTCILASFTPDVVWEYVNGKSMQGSAALADFFRERFSVFQRTSHHVGAPVITRDAGTGHIESVAYFMAVHLLRDGSSYSGYGRYVDRFVRLDGRLLVSHRRIVAHHSSGTDRATSYIRRNDQPVPPVCSAGTNHTDAAAAAHAPAAPAPS